MYPLGLGPRSGGSEVLFFAGTIPGFVLKLTISIALGGA
jgi:hypothetical protein